MTVLLRCAFDNADAAIVSSEQLQEMALGVRLRTRPAASWLFHIEIPRL
jgi:hypothetical protein